MEEIFPFTCPNCGIVLKAPRNSVGKQARCKQCRVKFRLTEPGTSGAAPVIVPPPAPGVKAAVAEAVREERRASAANLTPVKSADDRSTQAEGRAVPPAARRPTRADLHATRVDAAALDEDGRPARSPLNRADLETTRAEADHEPTIGGVTMAQGGGSPPAVSAPPEAKSPAKIDDEPTLGAVTSAAGDLVRTRRESVEPDTKSDGEDTGSTDEGVIPDDATVRDPPGPRAAIKPEPAKPVGSVPAEILGDGDTAATVKALRSAGVAPVTLSGDENTAAEAPPDRGGGGSVELSEAPKQKYTVVRKLAQGGMGAVLIAKDRDVNREVAMKVMLRPEQAGRDDILRFVEEAQATGQLEHPNIVPVHDVGLDEKGRLYFTMKFVRGRSLKDILEGLRDPKKAELHEEFSLTRMLQIFLQVCNAVAFAHNRGVVHRDLKPANIMLGSFGEVLVMDWGLAKILGRRDRREAAAVKTARSESGIELTVDGMIAGTPQYMPPEQAAGRIAEIDARSDVYALGAILYTMLTLRPPFQGPDAGSILTKVMVDPPEPFRPAPTYGGVPRELPAVALKAMKKEKAERYQTVRELADDVQRYLEGRSVSACPDGIFRRTWKWMKRHKTATLSTVAALVVAGGAVGGTLGFQRFQGELARRKELAERINTGNELLVRNVYSRTVPAGTDDYNAALQRRDVQEKLDKATQALQGATREYRRALELEPTSKSARNGLVNTYMRLWQLAFDRRDDKLMEAYADEVKTYAGAAFEAGYAAKLRGYGKFTLNVANADAEAALFRFEQFDGQYGRLVPVPHSAPRPATPGTPADSGTPVPPETAGYAKLNLDAREAPPRASGGAFSGSSFLLDNGGRLPERGAGTVRPAIVRERSEFLIEPLRPGSYLIVLRADGFQPVRVPFRIDRREDGGGEQIELTVEMLRAAAAVPGFTYVPRTSAQLGGPAAGALFPSARRRTVEPFFIQTREVSVADYIEFLEDLVKNGKRDDAARMRPKSFDALVQPGAAAETDRRYLVRISPEGKVEILHEEWRKPAEELKSVPVSGVSWNDARSYIEWKSAKDGRKYRLPSDQEWETAARGADGRTYSWGEIFRPEAAKLNQGYGAIGEKMLAELRAAKCDYDESPFGVFDLAGGVAEWVQDKFVEDNDNFRSIRGNAWGLTPTGLQCAFRTTGSSLNYFHVTIGFRMALDAPAKP